MTDDTPTPPDEATVPDSTTTLPVEQGQATILPMAKPKSTPRKRVAAPRADTRAESERVRGPAHILVQFRRGEKLNPEFEARVTPFERDSVVAKRHLERYFEILKAHRDRMALSAAELDQIASAILGLEFDDVSWVKQIPSVVAGRYGESSSLTKQLRAATLADLYAVLDAVQRRTSAKHGKTAK